MSITVERRTSSTVRAEYSVSLRAKRENRPRLIIGAPRDSAALFSTVRRVIIFARPVSLTQFCIKQHSFADHRSDSGGARWGGRCRLRRIGGAGFSLPAGRSPAAPAKANSPRYSPLNSHTSVLVCTTMRPAPSGLPDVGKKIAPSVELPGNILVCTIASALATAAVRALVPLAAIAAWRRCSYPCVDFTLGLPRIPAS